MACIEDLNEDCLLKITEYLNLEEQLQLWRSSEPTSRLRSVLSYTWQHQTHHIVDPETFGRTGRDVIQEFLQCIRSTVTKLTLQYLAMDLLEQWKPHTFPNVSELTYMGDENSEMDGDSDVAILVGCFPHLEGIGLSGNASGQHIGQWRNLRRLDLQLCWYLSTQCFEEICQNLQLTLQALSIQWHRAEEDAYVRAICTLQALEELELDIVHLGSENTARLLSLPKLRKLRLHNFSQLDDLLRDIGSQRGRDVVAAAFSDSIWMTRSEILAKFQSLRCLTLVDDEGCCAIDFRTTVIKCFPLLEQLHLENSRIWPNADGIWDVVLACPRLRLFSLSNQVLYDDFFAFSKSTMDRALHQRMEPLTMHFYRTGKEALISQHFRHPNLKICFSPTNNLYSQLSGESMELEFLLPES
ncbi:LOW QUALITY PROTEIN: uncharacterized protein LOC128253433 [Drosophila gunungcola]|uniref:LOW QUALITY PROTEIN: uncharacterized protein LOC128253433 n=1 Tax=Drosophila gunungcola TaxID=103775 RepID=UPI0022DF85E6|nr:LOW QUALITY PROTEIN: uncharacterized protein LOC128253433 [Drosophila gunungcola]